MSLLDVELMKHVNVCLLNAGLSWPPNVAISGNVPLNCLVSL